MRILALGVLAAIIVVSGIWLARDRAAPADPAESVADYFTRKLGRALYENVAGPLYGVASRAAVDLVLRTPYVEAVLGSGVVL